LIDANGEGTASGKEKTAYWTMIVKWN